MKTGEEDAVAPCPVPERPRRKGAHLVTVNATWPARDVQWMGPVFHYLGLSVASIIHDASFEFDPSYVTKTTPDELAPSSGGPPTGRTSPTAPQRVRLRLPARQHEVQPDEYVSAS